MLGRLGLYKVLPCPKCKQNKIEFVEGRTFGICSNCRFQIQNGRYCRWIKRAPESRIYWLDTIEYREGYRKGWGKSLGSVINVIKEMNFEKEIIETIKNGALKYKPKRYRRNK